jgi:ribosomal protein L11 methyltransferase
MRFVRISIEALSEAEDVISGLLLDMDFDGVQTEDIKAEPDRVMLSAYFPLDDTVGDRVFKIRRALDNMRELNPDIGDPRISLEKFDDKDWTEEWKSFFKPLLVGERIVIYQSWEKTELPDRDIRIQIDPGMAFGTGKHSTTILSLQLLEKVIKGGEKVADVGTGSGILAIATAKLGASRVLAIDVDMKAVEIAKENSQNNSVGNKIDVICGDLVTVVKGKFDVLIANILTNILLPMIPYANSYLNYDGYFILSGIMENEAFEIDESLRSEGFSILETPQHEEWVAFLAKATDGDKK